MEYIISPNTVIIESDKNNFAYNSIFGGLVKLSPEEFEILNKLKNKQDIKDIELISKLEEKHLIIQKGYDETVKMNETISQYIEKIKSCESITKLLLMVTEKCMLNCKYCYIDDAPGNENYSKFKNMSWEIAKISIDSFKEIIDINKQKRVHIRFHGGEPLLNFNIIKKSILYIEKLFKDVDVNYHINTNGITMTDEIAKFLSFYNVHTEISIDGNEQIHNQVRVFPNGKGSYKYAIRAINLLKKYNKNLENVNLAVTLSKYNYKDLLKIVDLAKELSVMEVEVNTLLFEHPLDILDNVDERVKRLVEMRIYGTKNNIKVCGKWFKLYERLSNPVINYCGRFGQQLCVDHSGEVFLCTGYMKKFGNINEWRSILKKDDYVKVCSRVIGKIEECKNCSIQGLCAGGCTASVIKSYNDLNAAESKECTFRKKIVEELIKNYDDICNNDIKLEEIDGSYVPIINIGGQELK